MSKIGRVLGEKRVRKTLMGWFLVWLGVIGTVAAPLAQMQTAQAEPVDTVQEEDAVAAPDENAGATQEGSADTTVESAVMVGNDPDTTGSSVINGGTCKDSLGALGWLVCPVTQKVAEAVDWLYERIESVLAIDPVKAEDGAPTYEIWKVFRGITNGVFIAFLLVVVYSQITGVGISNYGIKKMLPKLIVVAVVVNLSFIICSVLVDVSNIVGNGLREMFKAIGETAMGGMSGATGDMNVRAAEVYAALASGTAVAIGAGVIAFETGAIWMLIPVVLGAIVSVASGLITIALRQAVVTLLIMIAPLAIVAHVLPNTERLYQQWKNLLSRMLIFYPIFSLLFGASSLAGWAIISSATDGFGVILGIAVQIFPLFFSWSLMKMSGTILGTLNAKMTSLAMRPVEMNRRWATSHRDATRAKNLAASRAYTPSLRLQQFLSDRQVMREEGTKEDMATVRNRGLAYTAGKHYRRDGAPSRLGEEAYEAQARNLRYSRVVMRQKTDLNEGLGRLAVEGTAQRARLDALDVENVRASDALKIEQAHAEAVDYRNAAGFHDRMQDALDSHFDKMHGYETVKHADGTTERRRVATYKLHEMPDRKEAERRYTEAMRIMNGNETDVQYAAGDAAQAYDTQRKIRDTKMGKLFEYTEPTRDVEYRLDALTKQSNAAMNIDSIIAGMRVLNQRGDTDLLKRQLDNVLDGENGVQLGTHASQALASFLMFEVKDNDPFLRRFGKYINLQTANAYNKNARQNLRVTYDEYVNGEYLDTDGQIHIAKKGMKELVMGTALDGIERTALSNLDESLIKTYTYTGADGQKHVDVDKYLTKHNEIESAIGPAFISASLKWASGSEQLVSAVKFKTGLSSKEMRDSNGNIVTVLQPVWESNGMQGLSPEQKEQMRKYYARQTQKYIEDQTPSQILGLRSDYRDALMERLADMYEGDDDADWTDAEREEHRNYVEQMGEIQSKIAGATTDEARAEYEKEKRALQQKIVGKKFRKVLDAKGKLDQIYRTRRSGAANNAKDWVRDWLNLDSEILITQKLEESNRKRRKEFDDQRKQEPDAGNGAEDEVRGGFSAADRAFFATEVERIYNDMKGEDDEMIYEAMLEYVENELDGAGELVVRKYKEYRKNHPYADAHELREHLQELLQDPDNY